MNSGVAESRLTMETVSWGVSLVSYPHDCSQGNELSLCVCLSYPLNHCSAKRSTFVFHPLKGGCVRKLTHLYLFSAYFILAFYLLQYKHV